MVIKKLKKIISYFDNLSFKYKTSFLVFIIAGGMICIVLLSQISTFTIKQDFDVLFDKRTKSLIKLENIKDTYNVNIQDTIKDLENEELTISQAQDVLLLAQQLINKNWNSYKKELENKDDRFYIISFIKKFFTSDENYFENKVLKQNIMKNIDKKMFKIKYYLSYMIQNKIDYDYANLNLEINAISIYITSLINYDLSLAINEKRNTQKIFNIIMILSIISIILVFLFSIVLSVYIINNFKILHNSLEQKVEEKTKELTELNAYLEIKISKEVAQNRKKDIIMFQQARLASLGEMLNNIAHQWRQPLGSITMIVQSFQTKMLHGKLTDKFVDEKVQDALLLANNMSQTLDDFKNFFSPNKQKSTFEIKDCLDHSIELSKYSLEKQNIKIKLEIKQNVKLNTFYNELSHVFLNIISNSKDALCNISNKDDRIIKIIVNKYKHSVVVNLIDNGGGINEEIVSKIFEPYYTTKYKSAGTGIGLYMSKQIIEKHMNGSISYKNIVHKIKPDSNENFKCSLFTIKIPITNNKEATNE
ncbi:sensor histidine kinase [Arcobacter sp. YIC-310]|uniref:sensor histidine kinase n=1 Tax=Arcobacter sp. YIC-310 TaxID=3376632 RepID=UPI003C130656